MIRVTASLDTLDVSDCGPLDDPYVTHHAGRCQVWHKLTPRIMAWFRQQLARAAAVASKLSESDKADMRRMRAAYTELCKTCPPQGDPVAPMDGDEWTRLADFVDGDGAVLSEGGKGGTIVAWRPVGYHHRVYSVERGFIDEIMENDG